MSRNERTSLAGDAPVGPAYAVPSSSATALACLSGAVQRWFRQRFEGPTPIQRLAWPALAAGAHLLGCAPTGSGKTLAAFLPILDRLLCEPRGLGVRCLHVSPLKALAADVRKTLRRHLRDLRHFLGHAAALPRVGLRSGDTSPRQRRHLRRYPPDLLLTTPESLAVLLSQPSAPDWFAALRWVVVDELHALVPSKRGCDLALSLERLTELAGGPVQRIGLSATCAPLELAACFLAGRDRPCTIAGVAGAAPLHLQIEALPHDGDKGGAASFTGRLADRVERELQEHRTTLIFTNSRSLAERLGWALRERLSRDLVAVHHSALAPARRRAVERALQRGRLRAVVCSTSLELGIDIGAIDRVVLVHPPGEVVRLLQRVGRAGHAPAGRPSGLVLTDSPAELLEAAVTAASVPAVQFEPLRPVAQPLDVLCQHLLGLAAMGRGSADQAFDLVRRAWPYRHLSRDDFDACLDYLSGWPSEGVERLPARLRWQEGTFTIADRRTRRLVLRNLGTILSDEPRPVRRSDGSAVGAIDPAFADRLQAGDRFLLAGLCWEVRRSSAAEVRVDEAFGRPATPHWPAAGWPLSAPLARRLYLLRHRAAEALRDGPNALADLLQREYRLSGPALDILADYFHEQEAVSEIPQARTLLVEVVSGFFTTEYYLHTPLNRAANDALARVLVRRLERRSRGLVTSQVADLGILLTCDGTELLGPETMRALLTPADFEPDLQAALAKSDTLRDRFQKVAYTALMLLKNPLGRPRRVGGHDWPQRRLFDQLLHMDPDFVLLRQARRDAEDALDLASARAFVDELPRWTIRLRSLNQVSPFAADIGERAAALSVF